MSLLRRKPKPDVELVFTLESVELKGKAATVKPPAQVLVEVDVPGDEGDLQKSPAAAIKMGVAKLNFVARYVVGDGSSVRKAIVDALQTENEEDSEVIINLNAVNDKTS